MVEALPPQTPDRRNEQHRCTHCGSRFEVSHRGDPVGSSVGVEVKCPCCGGAHTISVPKGTENDLCVENLPGPEPDTGVVD